MNIDGFSESYEEARRKFVGASASAGAKIETFELAAAGPNAENLQCDAAWFGPASAERVFVTLSSVHGIEGYCGSGIQTAAIESGLASRLPPDTAMLHVHAINPFGFAHGRRVNEDNVDLNRNFVDFGQPLPDNPDYGRLHPYYCPTDLEADTLAECDRQLASLRAELGEPGYAEALLAGQYSHPRGLFFGGHAAAWSNGVLIGIFRKYAARAHFLAVLDFHTALGPFGEGQLIGAHMPDETGRQLSDDWYGGKVQHLYSGESEMPPINGLNALGVARALPEPRLCWVTIEFGSSPMEEVLAALREDNWLHSHGDPSSPEGRRIKARTRSVFYPDTDDWKRSVLDYAEWAIGRTLQGLAST